MKRLGWMRYFVWVPVLGVLIGLGALATRAQVIFSYEYSGGRGYAGLQGRTYTRCTYVGFSSITTLPATAGRCGWVRLASIGRR